MNTLFLKLIHPFPLTGVYEITGETLYTIKDEASRYKLFSLVYSRLHHYRDHFLPSEIIDGFLGQTRNLFLKGITLSAKQESIEKEISSLLAGKGIPSVVMKGNAIAEEIYGDLNCRTSEDIDILIRRQDAEKADSILKSAGYEGKTELPLIYCLSRIHHAIYVWLAAEMGIEIHWGFGVPYFFHLNSEQIWNTGVVSDSGNLKLSPEMTMIMLLIHHHSHAFRELKILIDLFWAFYKYDTTIDWKAFAKKLKEIGLMRTACITLHQMKGLWRESGIRLQSVSILDQELDRTVSGTLKFLLSYFGTNFDDSNSYKDKLIARFALDRISTVILSYFRTLFPVPEAIRELYQDRRRWSLPFNYLKFIRWRVKEWMG